MIKEIKMPSAGQTTDIATVAKWCVEKGDKVKRGDVLLEVETDKAVLPVESYTSGIIIDLKVKEGDVVGEGDVLVLIGDENDLAEYEAAGGAAPLAMSPPQQQQPTREISVDEEYAPIMKSAGGKGTAESSAPSSVGVQAMPNAKKLAREHGLKLSDIAPSNGRFITRADVKAALSAAGISVTGTDGAKAALAAGQTYTLAPMSKMRQIIARRMTESVQTIPAFQLTISVDMTALKALRTQMNETQDEVKVSYNDIIMKGIAQAAKSFPLINARFEEDEVRVNAGTHIGIAVAVDDGLVVPVVRHTERLGIAEIAKESRRLVEHARQGKLAPDDMGCGSITVSNLGMYGVEQFTAIINPPESSILAIGAINTVPAWGAKGWKPVERMSITGSFDHRIMDGAYGAAFLQTLKALLETPALMLM